MNTCTNSGKVNGEVAELEGWTEAATLSQTAHAACVAEAEGCYHSTHQLGKSITLFSH